MVNASGCEPTAILLTAVGGTVLFYSMATNFSTAALTADGMGADIRMLIGNGYAPDRGAYGLDLVRRSAALREALGVPRRRRGMSAAHTHRVQLRWRDLDGLGHVNHNVVLTYLEEGRDAFLEERGIGRVEYVVGRCSIEFLAEIDPEQKWITAECAVSEIGRSSITTSERLLDESRGRRRRRRPFGHRALGFGATRVAPDHRRGAGGSDQLRGGSRVSAWNSDPVVVTVAVTGADVFRENNPNIPYTPEEIADSAIEASAAGATVAHLHVREDDGTPSGRPELFVDVIDRIRAGCDVLTMVSTGGSNEMTIEERTTGLTAEPDLSGVESGSMNFGDETFITPPPAGRGIAARATEAGIALEVEVFDVGHVVSAVRWLEEGMIAAPLRINLVFGVPGGIDASPEALDAMLRPLPPEAFWTVTCIGRHHQRMLALALLRGAPGIRTGLEDVAYLSRGVHAPSNAALVEMATGLARTLGREVATQEQTRELLQLG